MRVIQTILLSLVFQQILSSKEKSEKLMYGVISEKCFQTLVFEQQLDVPCIKFTFSKVLGMAIVVLAPLAKIPQIINILKAGSVKGLSFTSNFIDSIAYCFTLAYNVKRGFAFSTYGENAFLLVQNMIIFILFLSYSENRHVFYRQLNFIFLFLSIASVLMAQILPEWVYSYLVMINIAFLLFSKIPQIYLNFSEKSTGTLSFITNFLFFGGSAARTITLLIEVPDQLQQLQYVLTTLLNGLIFAQILLYWNSAKIKKD